MRRAFALVWALATAAIAALVGVLSYQAGWAAGIATRLPEGAVRPYDYDPGFFGFFGLIPLLFFILFLVLIFRVGRRRWGGHGYWGGRGYWGGTPPHVEDRLQEWHRKAHGEAPPAGGEKPAEGPGRQ